MDRLNELHVDRYYGVPIYNQNQPNANVDLLCIEHPSPYKLKQFEEKYLAIWKEARFQNGLFLCDSLPCTDEREGL